jgi:DNA-binding beta-propeller fold protein YncE
MLYRSNCRALNVIVAKRILIVSLFVSLGGFDPRTVALNDEGKPVIILLIENSSPLVLLRNDLMSSRFGWSDYMYVLRLHGEYQVLMLT